VKSARKVAQLCDDLSPRYNEEHIHKMRTTVKKMRALTRWTGLSPIVMKGYIKKIYRLAGSIRDMQLLLMKLDTEENVPSAFRVWLESRLQEMKQEWEKVYDVKKIDEWCKTVKRDCRDHGFKKASEEFTNDRSSSLQTFKTERPLSDEGIHGGRKTIKDIQFVNVWQNKLYGMVHENSSAAQMKVVADEAGNYMDVCKRIELLDDYILQEEAESELLLAQQLREKWVNEKGLVKSKVIENIDMLKEK